MHDLPKHAAPVFAHRPFLLQGSFSSAMAKQPVSERNEGGHMKNRFPLKGGPPAIHGSMGDFFCFRCKVEHMRGSAHFNQVQWYWLGKR